MKYLILCSFFFITTISCKMNKRCKIYPLSPYVLDYTRNQEKDGEVINKVYYYMVYNNTDTNDLKRSVLLYLKNINYDSTVSENKSVAFCFFKKSKTFDTSYRCSDNDFIESHEQDLLLQVQFQDYGKINYWWYSHK